MEPKSENLTLPEKIFTVSEISELIKLGLEASFPRIWITGEISNFHRHTSGHLYFTLKDQTFGLQAVMWRSEAAKLKFDLKDGQQLICRGRITAYGQRSQYQLVVEFVEPKGKGALQLAFEQLKERLRAEGLFDPQRKKKLPLLPKTIGVVTSPKGAALVDILRTLERRFAKLRILIYPARVQGEGAADQITAGLDYLGSLADIDAIIVGRGGGSIEDLWAFNEEKVARAIFRCPVPVISAVGHEVDFTIADFVADIRASTPTAAAEMVIEKEQAFTERIDNLERRAVQGVKFTVRERRQEVTTLAQHRIFQTFKVRLMTLAQYADDLESRAWEVVRGEQKKIAEAEARTALLHEKATNLIRRLLRDRLAAWERLSAGLHGRSPLDILKKGYTLCWTGDGRRAVTAVEDVRTGEKMLVSFYKGEFRCRVEDVDREKRIESRAGRPDGEEVP
jgi:exodeoxyribonuclease VII large subunit